MASKKAWFQKGEAGRKQAESEDAAAEARRKARSGPQRFYLKNDTSAKSTFLDNPDFFLHEHNLKINGKFYNYFTCLKDIDTCPICDDGDQPSYIVVATIIDHRKFTKEGKEYVNEKKLIVFKGRARQRIMNWRGEPPCRRRSVPPQALCHRQRASHRGFRHRAGSTSALPERAARRDGGPHECAL